MAAARLLIAAREFLRQVAAGGVLLVLAVAPSEGLMAVFFLLVGLEGELSSAPKSALPAIAALGGIGASAAVYAALNWGDAAALRAGRSRPRPTSPSPSACSPCSAAVRRCRCGPSCSRSPSSTTSARSRSSASSTPRTCPPWGSAGHFVLVEKSRVLAALNRTGVTRVMPYTLAGVVLSARMPRSGVHAALAGVATAFAVPLRTLGGHASPLLRLDRTLNPLARSPAG